MARERLKLGEMLMEAGFIDDNQLLEALDYQKQFGCRLGSSLLEMGFVSERNLLVFLAEQLELPNLDPLHEDVQQTALDLLPVDKAIEYSAIPICIEENKGKKSLLIALHDPTNLTVIDDLQFITGCRIRPGFASAERIRKALQIFYKVAPRMDAEPDISDDRLQKLIDLLRRKGILDDTDVQSLL